MLQSLNCFKQALGRYRLETTLKRQSLKRLNGVRFCGQTTKIYVTDLVGFYKD